MLRSQGKQVHAIKPVASGCQRVDGELISDDALKLANGYRALMTTEILKKMTFRAGRQ